MKQALVIAFTIFFAFGCNDKSSTTDVKTTDAETTSAPIDKMDYPYTLDQPYKDWQPGNQIHAVNVMKGLKAYENGDINACVASFGDSVELKFDGYRAKLSNDSLKKMLTKSRGELSAIKVKMGDWESVISKDKKDEYVTLWYKEIQTDKKGKTDSLSIVDDLKIVNGKIVELDQKIQHYPAAKKK
ncbi:MAG: hypothetical protein H0V14_02635 [Chitinophagaceae bacterium]|nr:hypothetical protein [Chitinophagaceae bacterium]